MRKRSFKIKQPAKQPIAKRDSADREAPVKTKRASVKTGDTPREILLVAARRLFARKGLSGTTIRDIGIEANMNSSQISYYFTNKEGLYRACIQDIAEQRIKIAEQILLPPASREEYRVRLQLFVDNLFHHFLEDRDAGLIIIREYDRMHSPAAKVFKAHFIRLFEVIGAFFNKALTHNFMRPLSVKNDPTAIASLFFGLLISELRFDHIKEDLFSRTIRDEEERRQVVQLIVELFS